VKKETSHSYGKYPFSLIGRSSPKNWEIKSTRNQVPGVEERDEWRLAVVVTSFLNNSAL
jgi:hypothetical protein